MDQLRWRMIKKEELNCGSDDFNNYNERIRNVEILYK